MQKRALGRTGRELSVIGFGGVLVWGETPESAADLVARAADQAAADQGVLVVAVPVAAVASS